jgi:DNA mismatch repair protein MutL
MSIHTLPTEVISQIAAGEVIERPVYAVKELIENAIDAKADTITIVLEESGLKRITVIDNGEGMTPADLQVCFMPHTTSKIHSIENLHQINTLGFRGEALASIAAISNMTIKSRTHKGGDGVIIEIKSGEIHKKAPTGIPPGTQITVNNLFYTTPARKKFLKSARTEFRHCIELLTKYALAYPSIRFSLTHNGKQTMDLPQTTDQTERLRALLNPNLYEALLPFNLQNEYFSLNGFITKPQTATYSQKQYLFVNNRAVSDKQISQAIKDAYGTLLDPLAHPSFVLFLTLQPDFIDINIHPRKEEIRFINSRIVYESIYNAVTQALEENNLVFHTKDFNQQLTQSPRFGHTDSFAAQVLKENSLPWQSRNITTILPSSDLQQIHNLYLITQTKYGMLLIDQHAAHERILYEELFQEFKKQKRQPSYQLPQSLIFELSLSEGELLQENTQIFQQLGFEIEYFKDNTFLLTAIPVLFKDRNNIAIIMEILQDVSQDKQPKEIDKTSRKMIAYLACRSAIKAGEKLSKKQARELLKKLEQTPNNTTCPHARPTKIEIELPKLNRLFRR